jgi:hypothetical protein
LDITDILSDGDIETRHWSI